MEWRIYINIMKFSNTETKRWPIILFPKKSWRILFTACYISSPSIFGKVRKCAKYDDVTRTLQLWPCLSSSTQTSSEKVKPFIDTYWIRRKFYSIIDLAGFRQIIISFWFLLWSAVLNSILLNILGSFYPVRLLGWAPGSGNLG